MSLSLAQASAQRRIRDFQHKYGEATLRLAYHAALPVALDADLLHLLRINFFLDPPEALPFTAESDLLLSPLCQEIGEGLYEIEAETRNVLLQGLALTDPDSERMREVATLLWRYVEQVAPWAQRVELERAQQLTALSFLAPAAAQQWLTAAEQHGGRTQPVEREWFVAMRQELSRPEAAEIPPVILDMALRDLRLPQELAELLAPPLQSLGFRLADRELQGVNGLSRRFTVIHNGVDPARLLLHLPPWVTAATHPATVDKVAASAALFDPGAMLFVLAQQVDVLPPVYQTVMDEDWAKGGGFQVSFIPWRDLQHLRTLDEESRVSWVGEKFKLNAPTPSPAPVPPRVAPTTRQTRLLIDFDWVTIPAGEFRMGSNKRQDKLAYDNETPQHQVNLPTYRMARTPVTNAQFRVFVEATKQPALPHWKDGQIPRGKEQHPVVYVDWRAAQAFCRWASEQSGQSIRLPSEAEWEKAARGEDGQNWPWGNEPPTERRCNFNGQVGDTTAVGGYPDGASPYGCLDMAGNVWEWTSSLFKPYPYKADDGREDAAASGSRTLRGGSWIHNGPLVRCAYRRGPPLTPGASVSDFEWCPLAFEPVDSGFSLNSGCSVSLFFSGGSVNPVAM